MLFVNPCFYEICEFQIWQTDGGGYRSVPRVFETMDFDAAVFSRFNIADAVISVTVGKIFVAKCFYNFHRLRIDYFPSPGCDLAKDMLVIQGREAPSGCGSLFLKNFAGADIKQLQCPLVLMTQQGVLVYINVGDAPFAFGPPQNLSCAGTKTKQTILPRLYKHIPTVCRSGNTKLTQISRFSPFALPLRCFATGKVYGDFFV